MTLANWFFSIQIFNQQSSSMNSLQKVYHWYKNKLGLNLASSCHTWSLLLCTLAWKQKWKRGDFFLALWPPPQLKRKEPGSPKQGSSTVSSRPLWLWESLYTSTNSWLYLWTETRWFEISWQKTYKLIIWLLWFKMGISNGRVRLCSTCAAGVWGPA